MKRRFSKYHTGVTFVSIAVVLLVLISLLCPAPSAAQTSPGTLSYPIVDTGQTACYGNAGSITPPAPGANFYGQDAQYEGNQPQYHNNGDGTITDLVTGLMWVKERGNLITWDNALSSAPLCTVGGYNDWRMPTIKELYSLINFTGKQGAAAASSKPYLDTTYFDFEYGNTSAGERLIDCQDWSSNQYVSTTMNGDDTIFGVNFADGRIKGYPRYIPGTSTGQDMYVRYVRGNAQYGINNFTSNGDGTISDAATGLMWAADDSGYGMNWQLALAWVQEKNAQNFLGHNDWRLPNAKELQSIVDYTRSPDTTGSAALDSIFNCTQITDEGGTADYPFFWTGTTHLDNMYGVYVSFGEALGYMEQPPSSGTYVLLDVHGAGAQRSDPKTGNYTDFFLGYDSGGNPVYGHGPQGDVIRVDNYVRCVRDDEQSSVPEITVPAIAFLVMPLVAAVAMLSPLIPRRE